MPFMGGDEEEEDKEDIDEDIDDDLIRKAVEKASLDKFLNNLPEGLETIVGEGGIRLASDFYLKKLREYEENDMLEVLIGLSMDDLFNLAGGDIIDMPSMSITVNDDGTYNENGDEIDELYCCLEIQYRHRDYAKKLIGTC